MKKLLFLFTSLIASCTTGIAQNYQTVNPYRVSLFYSQVNKNYVYLKVDSIDNDFGDLIVYPSKEIGCSNGDDYYCVTPESPSWLGSKIILKNDNETYFNREKDSIVFKPNAKLGEEWIVYRLKDSITIKAEVVDVKIETFLEQRDSVKTIRFLVYDSKGNRISHLLDQMPVSISQTYGWLTVLNFYNFPNLTQNCFQHGPNFTSYSLVGIDNPKLGLQNLTWFEVSDFHPGDVLHVFESHTYFCANGFEKTTDTSYKYLKRTDYSTDSILYVVDRIQREHYEGKEPTTIHDTIKMLVRVFPEFNSFPNEPIFEQDSSMVKDYSMFCDSKGVIIKRELDYPIHKSSEKDSCWISMSEPIMLVNEYYKGLGGPYFRPSAAEGCEEKFRELVYYQKDSTEWGTPFDFTNALSNYSEEKIKLYPNPATNHICIELLKVEEPVLFELISTSGRILMQQIIYSSEESIDVSSIKKGTFIYLLISGQRIVRTGKISIR